MSGSDEPLAPRRKRKVPFILLPQVRPEVEEQTSRGAVLVATSIVEAVPEREQEGTASVPKVRRRGPCHGCGRYWFEG